MTPNGAQQQTNLIMCGDCGSVRFPVPAIMAQQSPIVVPGAQVNVTACPVCGMAKALRAAAELAGLSDQDISEAKMDY